MNLATAGLAGSVAGFAGLVSTGVWLRPRLTLRLSAGRGGAGASPAEAAAGRHRPAVCPTWSQTGRRAGDGLRGFVRPYRGALTVTVALSLSQTLLALAGPWPLKLIIDNAISGRPLSGAIPLPGGVSGSTVVGLAVALGVGLVVASAAVGYLVAVLVGTVSLNIATDLRVAVFDRLLHLPVAVHDRHRSGDLVTRLTADVSRVQEALVARIQVALPGIATMLGMAALMLWLDTTLALLVLSAVPPLTVLALVRQRRVAEVQRVARTRSGELAAQAAEVMRHVRAVQTFGQHTAESSRFQSVSTASATAARDALETSARLVPAADLLLAAVLGAVLWIGTARVVSGQISLGELMVFLTYLASVRAPIRSLSGLAATLGRGAASRERLMEILGEAPLQQAEHPRPRPGGLADLELDRVSFGYRPGTPVLRDVSVTVSAGQTTCIVGPTGAGKSTLLSLLVRLHDPDSGTVRIGGVDVADMVLSEVRSQFSFVPQDAWMMAGTIADNVRYGTPDATDEQVYAAGAAALVDELTDRLPDGYLTPVGEGGLLLSGGQRRRIALARAILRDSPVLLLDEPTSGLDATSEAMVIEAVRRVSAGRTVLIVTHHLALAEVADQVVVVAGGRVVETGSPVDLRRRPSGAYAALLDSRELGALPALPSPPNRGRAPRAVPVLQTV